MKIQKNKFSKSIKNILKVEFINILILGLLLPFISLSLAHAHGNDINLSIAGKIQPGVYGRININNSYIPDVPVIYNKPIIITQQHWGNAPPVYMYVPRWHARQWNKHCYRYGYCDRPVYFINEEKVRYNHYYDRDERRRFEESARARDYYEQNRRNNY